MRIIPAIDLIGGKCVRLTGGRFDSVKVYDENPVEVAKRFEGAGLRYLHLVDLDGARNGSISGLGILESIADSTQLKVDFSGGINSDSDLQRVFEAGAEQATIGSVALNNPGLFLRWLSLYGNDRIILGADSKERKIRTRGWMEGSDTDVCEYIAGYSGKGIRYTICTDISSDGMMSGPSIELYRDILLAADVNLIASGGISSVADIESLERTGCEGAIIGKAIYEGKITLKELAGLC